MPAYASLPRRAWLALTVLALSLTAGLPSPARPAAAAGELTAAPNVLALSLPFGASAGRTIALTNTTASVQKLTMLEAFGALPAARVPDRAGPARPVALPAQPARLDPRLLAELRTRPDTPAQFAVYLRDQADLAPAYQLRDWAARGRWVHEALRAHAERSQRGLRAALAARGLDYQPLWIVNAIVVRGRLADAQALAARADVALLRADRVAALPALRPSAGDARCSPDEPANLLCWNIRRVGAERVWRDFGVNGQGVVVANIDTGVRFDHPALRAQYRGYLGAAGEVHDYNWFDPKLLARAPADPNGHGTHTLGTMVAAGSDVRPAVGVAPGARWIAAQGCAGNECSELDLIAAAQWMLAPTTLAGRDPRPDLRPLIINNSWSSAGGDDWYTGYTAAWRAAGIFPVFAAGNTGSACGSIGSPGDYADVLAVGATDQRDLIAAFSARGPAEDGRLKPDLAAPGGSPGILSTGPGAGDDYRALQGTSMAAPHVAGIVALLWAATPSLVGDYEATLAVLQASAQPAADSSCGATGVLNNVYGAGRVDAYAAVQRSRPDVPWLSLVAPPGQIAANGGASLELLLDAAYTPGPGVYQARVQIYTAPTAAPLSIVVTLTVTAPGAAATVSGRVLSADTGAPVQATIGAAGGQPSVAGQDGRFSLLLPLGEQLLTIGAPGFVAQQRALSLSGDQQLGDIALAPAYPQIEVAAARLEADLRFGASATFPISVTNRGLRTLHYQARVWPDQFATFRSGEPGGPGYAWVSLPSSAKVIELGDLHYTDEIPLGFEFPFFNYTFTETLVAEDGFVAFARPPGAYSVPTNGCFPDTSFSFYAIAPLRSDFDLALGGRIRYATVEGGHTFVVSFEDVRPSGDASAAYSFQLLLRSDGRIVYQYRSVPRLPAQLAVGVQRTQLDYQALGCGSAAPVGAGQAIELRPQPDARQWIELAAASGSVPPGGSAVISATLGWVLPRTPVQRGRIELESDDPIRTRVVLPAQLTPLAPPWRFWLPAITRPLF